MSKVKRQKKSGFFIFAKNIRHRGTEGHVEIPDEVEDYSKTAPCHFWIKRFSNTQG